MTQIAQSMNTSLNTSTSISPAWGAVAHAKQYDAANIGRYSDYHKAVGEKVKSYVEATFPGSRVYLNYRKNFIAVKAEGVSIGAAFSVHTDLLESWASMAKIQIAVHGQNVIFRIYPDVLEHDIVG